MTVEQFDMIQDLKTRARCDTMQEVILTAFEALAVLLDMNDGKWDETEQE